LIISYVLRKNIGAVSLPSLLFDLFERFLVTFGVIDESVRGGTGLDMLMGNCEDTTADGFSRNICCMLLFFISPVCENGEYGSTFVVVAYVEV